MRNYKKSTLELSDTVGDFIQYWGFRKIHGRVWTLIYLSNGPVAAGDLISQLEVSKGLISTTIATLLEYKLIFEAESLNKKNKLYLANTNLTSVITGVLKAREKKLLDSIAKSYAAIVVSDDIELDQKRVKQLGRHIKFANRVLNSLVRFGSIGFSEWKKIEGSRQSDA
jgi:DNA-binding transcriptional regulator GbsR (MarR family)